MSKRMPQGTGEEIIVAMSQPMLNLVSHTAASSSTAPSSSASNCQGILRAPSQQGSNLMVSAGKPAAGGSHQNDAASSSQVWQRDAKTNDSARKLATAGTNQDLSFQDCARKFAAEVPKSSTTTTRSGRTNRKPEDKMEDHDVNTLILGMLLTVTLQAAVHLGNDYLENLHSSKNQPQRTVKPLFDVTKMLIRDQKEIQGISVIDWQQVLGKGRLC